MHLLFAGLFFLFFWPNPGNQSLNPWFSTWGNFAPQRHWTIMIRDSSDCHTWNTLLPSSGESPATLLNILGFAGWPHNKDFSGAPKCL